MPTSISKLIDIYANIVHHFEWWLSDRGLKNIALATRWLNAGVIGLVYSAYSWI